MTKVTSKKSGNRLLDSTELMPEILFIFSDKSGKSKFNKLPPRCRFNICSARNFALDFRKRLSPVFRNANGAIYFHRLQTIIR